MFYCMEYTLPPSPLASGRAPLEQNHLLFSPPCSIFLCRNNSFLGLTQMEPLFCLYIKGLQGSSSTVSAAEGAGPFQQGAAHYQFLITPNCPSPVRQQCNTQTQSTAEGTPTFPLHTGALGGATGAHSTPVFHVQLLLALPLLLQQG